MQSRLQVRASSEDGPPAPLVLSAHDLIRDESIELKITGCRSGGILLMREPGVLGAAGGCFSFKTSLTVGEYGSSASVVFPRRSNPPLPLFESSCKAAWVFP